MPPIRFTETIRRGSHEAHAHRTLAQHCGSDAYLDLVTVAESRPIDAINRRTRELLASAGEAVLWEVLSGPNIFETQPVRLDRWLELTGSRRAVFGHKPHRGARPQSYHGGKAINFDGGLSRSHRLYQRSAPLAASVGPLDQD